MEEKIKVLILEDLPSDAELAEREVKTVLKSYTALVTDTEQGFIQALETFKPDLIISDYSLPTFNGMKALQITREKGLSTPFIILTGSMNEDTAVDCMKAGADDYVIKEHIKRLGAAILNALDKKKKRQQRKQAMEEIEKLAKFPAENPNPVLRISKDGTVLYHNKGSELLLDQWHCQDGQKLPDIWSKLVIESIQDNEIKSADVEIADTVFSLTFAPIIEKDFVNVYGLDITERKQAEEKIKHLNRVLRAVRNVNQLITKEKDRDRLIKKACENMVATRGYFNAWIALWDDSGKFLTSAEANYGKDFLPVIELMKSGKLTACGKEALKKKEVITIKNPTIECKDCPLSGKYANRSAVTIRLEYEGKIYGLISVSIPRELITDEEEHNLFKEMAEDISFALHSIEAEKKRRQTEEELKASNQKLQASEQQLKASNQQLQASEQQLKASNKQLIEHEKEIKKHSHDLGERVKELNCFYGISKIVEIPDISLEEIFQRTVELIPTSWQYPEITVCRIILDGIEYKTPDFRKTNWRQCSDIIVDGKHAGDIEVYYLVEKPNLDEGPFLKEERLVLDTIAERLRGITQLKKADEALKDSEIRFHGLFENSSEFLFTLDLKGNFTDINKAAEIITGYTKSELLKMNFKDYTSKRDHRKLLITFSNIYKTGKPLHDLPIEAIMKDGSVKYFETSFSLLKKGEQIIGFQGSSKDVTARKQAEEELRISNENTKIIIEKAPVGVVVIGKDRKIKMINDTALKMAGVDTPDDILGKNCSEYLCPAQKLDCPILDRDQKVDNSERIFRRKDGKEIPIIKTVTEISLDGEDVLLETFVDITERKQAEETLKKRMNELEIFNDAAVDRELKMLELKKEINELLEKSGQKPKYEIPV